MKSKYDIQEILRTEFPWLLKTRFFEEKLEQITEHVYKAALHVQEDEIKREKEALQARKAMLGYNSATQTVCLIHATRTFESLLQHKDEFPEIMSFEHSFPSDYAGREDKSVNQALKYLSNKAGVEIIVTGRKIKHYGIYDCSYHYSGHNDRGFVELSFRYDEIWELGVLEELNQ